MGSRKMEKVCVIGMGYVGLTLAVSLAEKGCPVLGIENNPRVVKLLQECRPDVHEKYLADLYICLKSRKSIEIYESIPHSCDATVFVITVGTPLDSDGHSSMAGIQNVAAEIAKVLKDGDLVILRSTVKVGTTETIVKPILDTTGVKYFLAMCPERTVEGKALEELDTLPQLVGGINDASLERATIFFETLGTRVVPLSSAAAAEFSKLICNTQRDLYYAFSNEVALLAEDLDLNAHEIIKAVNQDYPRSEIARPGLVAGPCLEKDVYILAESMPRKKPELALSARNLHENIVSHAVHLVAARAKNNKVKIQKVAIMGLAFKGEPETGDVRGSLAIQLQKELQVYFPEAEICGFDPIATLEESARWGLSAKEDMTSALKNADAVFIQTNHKTFRGKAFARALAQNIRGGLVYDFWKCLHPDALTDPALEVIALGDTNPAVAYH